MWNWASSKLHLYLKGQEDLQLLILCNTKLSEVNKIQLEDNIVWCIQW